MVDAQMVETKTWLCSDCYKLYFSRIMADKCCDVSSEKAE